MFTVKLLVITLPVNKKGVHFEIVLTPFSFKFSCYSLGAMILLKSVFPIFDRIEESDLRLSNL